MKDTIRSSIRNSVGEKPIIGKGLSSVVYPWGEGKVLKLFETWVQEAKIRREFTITQALHAARLPVPAVYEIVEQDGRLGIVFERIDGISLLKSVQARPWKLFSAVRQLAELHAQLHSVTAPPELPSQHEQLAGWIDAAKDYSPAQKEAARAHLARLPSGDAVCHGDFHPDNILLSQHGPIIIDWIAGTRGHPVGDVARTSILFEQASLPAEAPVHMKALLKCARTALHRTYLQYYFRLRPGSPEEIEAWRLPQTAAISAWKAQR
jgi:uncharacterized protein (TIGR02172 family)